MRLFVAVTAAALVSFAASNASARPAFRSNALHLFFVPPWVERHVPASMPLRAARTSWMHPDKSSGCIYLSDQISQSVNVYAAKKPFTLLGNLTSASGYGYGLAATKIFAYVGTANGTIDEYAPCAGSTPVNTLTGGSGEISSIAVTKFGAVYATSFPNPYIEEWAPDGNFIGNVNLPGGGVPYFVAVDKSANVFVDGFNSAQSAAIVRECNHSITKCSTLGFAFGFPGGIALDKHQNLFVDDQFGTLYEYAPPYNASTLLASFTYTNGSDSLEYLTIALDAKLKNLWGANIYLCSSSYGLCSNAQANPLPLGSLGASTPQWDNAEAGGIAVYKPAKI